MLTHYLGRFKRTIAAALAVTMFVAGAGAPRVEAMIAPTQHVAPAAAFDRTADMAKVQATLENKVIRQRLHDLGLNDAEIDRRLAKLSDAQVHQVAMQIDKQAPAGDGGGIAITVLVIVLLVLLILKLADDI